MSATAWRSASETVALLAARSPALHRALRDAKEAGHAYVVIDGTLICTAPGLVETRFSLLADLVVL